MQMYTYGDNSPVISKVSPQLLRRSKNRVRRHLLFICLTTMIGMTAYEGLKQFVLPKITVWQSHTITIIFSTILATIVAHFILQKRETLFLAMQELQERFSGIYNSSKDAIGFATLDGVFLDVNESFVNLTGYSKQELISDKLNLTPKEYHQVEAKIISGLVSSGQPVEYEKEYTRKDGTRVPISVTAFIVRGQQEEPIGIAAIVKDITERKRAMQILRDAHDELETRVQERTAELTKANEALQVETIEREKAEEGLRQAQKMEAIGRLAGGIAHDFNNLLAVIIGYSEMIHIGLDAGSPLRRDAEGVLQASERAAALVDQLLAFSRKKIVQLKMLDLNSLVVDTEKMLRRLIGENIELITNLRANLGRVKADAGQMEQVIINLSINARDAMPDGGKLLIETDMVLLEESFTDNHTGMQPGAHVMLAISDTGTGIDSKILPRIFEPFFTTKEVGKGTGLGLSTTFGTIKQSNGHISVYSESGHGTTFKIYLPVSDSYTEVSSEPEDITEFPGGIETVLVVEDEPRLRELTARTLRDYGYQVLEAEDGKSALLLTRERPDVKLELLLTDMMMPEMSGRRLAEELKKEQPEMEILYMSGYTDDAIVQQGVLEQGLPFLQKPFTREALVRKVRGVLDKSSQQDDLAAIGFSN
jgi:PAS domain S-box-containing protein